MAKLSAEQKEQLRNLKGEDRSEFLEALGMKDDGGDLAKTVEKLQEAVTALQKDRTPTPPKKKQDGPFSWLGELFGG